MAWSRERADSDGRRRHTGYYRDPAGKTRSAGHLRLSAFRITRRAASRGKGRTRHLVRPASRRITFREHVEEIWWPSRHLEITTKAGYRSYLDRHFLPFFGDLPMADILPSTVQAWVTQAVADGLSARSVVKYHVMLHSVFKRAVRDRVIGYNPCADTELPKVVPRKTRILTPEGVPVLVQVPDRFRPGPHRDRDRPAMGRADRAAPPTRRLPPTDRHGRGDHRRGFTQGLPYRRTIPGQAVPQEQRARIIGVVPTCRTARPQIERLASVGMTFSSPPPKRRRQSARRNTFRTR